MRKYKPRVLFTEQDSVQQQYLRYYLEEKGAEVYFSVRNITALINEIKRIKADMVVTDVFLAGSSAVHLKEQCMHENLSSTLFVAVSAFDNQEIADILADSGFDAVLVKPYDPNILLEKLRTVAGEDFGRIHFENPLEEEADRILQYFHMTGNLSGRRYLRQAIVMACEEPQIMQHVTTILYPRLAELNGTTASNVERSMRNAIKVTWERGNSAAFMEYFGYRTNNLWGRPTNSEFIIATSCALRSKINKEQAF